MTVTQKKDGGTTKVLQDLTPEQAAEQVFAKLSLLPEERVASETPPAALPEQPVDAPTPAEPEDTAEDAPEDIEATDEPADEESEPTPESQPRARSRKVKLPDGNEQEVTEDEAYLGYLRTADYTRKTQQAAELRKQLESDHEMTRAERAQYQELLKGLRSTMEALVPGEPDWAQLERSLAPEQYIQAEKDWRAYQGRLEAVRGEQKRVADKDLADRNHQIEEYVKTEAQRLVEALPEWKDETKLTEGRNELRNYAKSLGFSDAEVGNVIDHRLVIMLRKSMQYDRLQAKKPAVEARAKAAPARPIRTATPGTPSNRPASTKQQAELKSARERLVNRGGKIDDAARLIELTLKG